MNFLDKNLMNKQYILQNIKSDIAKELGLKTWYNLLFEKGGVSESLLSEIANRYAIAMCEEQKKECLKQAEATYHSDVNGTWIDIDEQSILNAKNVAE